jgi:outer membrane protein assembly factor BamB
VSAGVTNDLTFWLKAISDPSLNRGSVGVQPGFSSDPEEQIGVFRPIGRRTAVVVSSGLQGEDGRLDIRTGSTSEFEEMWALATHTGTLLLQMPDATQKYIRVTSRSFQREGTLGSPLTTIRVDYVEVDG